MKITFELKSILWNRLFLFFPNRARPKVEQGVWRESGRQTPLGHLPLAPGSPLGLRPRLIWREKEETIPQSNWSHDQRTGRLSEPQPFKPGEDSATIYTKYLLWWLRSARINYNSDVQNIVLRKVSFPRSNASSFVLFDRVPLPQLCSGSFSYERSLCSLLQSGHQICVDKLATKFWLECMNILQVISSMIPWL